MKKTLSKTQAACLRCFCLVEDGSPWDWGSGTLTSLEKLGLLERFRSEALRGESRWRATPAGRRLAAIPGYYVSAIDGGRHALAAGPYATHAEALARVESVRSEWDGRDPRAAFAGWGTCRIGLVGSCGCLEPHDVVVFAAVAS
jgi:hypothetical protein